MKFLTIALLLTLVPITQAASADEMQEAMQTSTPNKFGNLYSGAGYPYDLLLKRSNSLKIIYTIEEQKVTCSVVLADGDKTEESSTVVVNKKRFEEEPLANCLVRQTAKKWLAATF